MKNFEIYYKCNRYIKLQSKIILENIKNLRIEGNMFIYNNFQFPNLEYYYLNIDKLKNIKYLNININKNSFIYDKFKNYCEFILLMNT